MPVCRVSPLLVACFHFDSHVFDCKYIMRNILLALSFLVLPSTAQILPNRLSPLFLQQTAMMRATRAAADATFPAFIHVTNDDAVEALVKAGVKVNYRVKNILSVRVPLQTVAELSSISGVHYVEGAAMTMPMLDKACAATGVNRIHDGENLPQAFTGKGVLVGVVDAGFDYRQPAFRSSDGVTSRLLRSWEQAFENGTSPQGYNYGGEFVGGGKLIEAKGDVTTSSHGSHVLGIAAGRDCGNGWGGVAPDADLAVVSMGAATEGNVNIADGVAYLFNLAKERQQPCVVNLSLGTQIGPHDGTSTFDQLTDAMQGAGCILVGSAGNFGSDLIHVASVEGKQVRTLIGYKNGVVMKDVLGTVDVWGTKDKGFKVQVQLVKISTGDVTTATEWIDAAKVDGSSVTCELKSNAKGTVTVHTEVNPFNSRPHALISLNMNNFRSGYGLAVSLVPDSKDSRVDAWADDAYVQFVADKEGHFDAPDTERTLAEIGGTGKRIISVGSFTTRNEYVLDGSSKTNRIEEQLDDISSFSSAGPTLDGRMKPDVAAPGCLIVSALNGNSVTLGSELLAGKMEFEGNNHYWGYMQGTSMASPFVAGTVALWLQANPTLTPEQVRDVLDHSSQMKLNNAAYDATRWGRGRLDAWEGLKYVVNTLGVQSTSAAAPTKFSVRRTADRNIQVLFASASLHAPLRLYSLSGALLRQQSVDEALGAVTIRTSSLPSGTYLLQVDGQSVKVVL